MDSSGVGRDVHSLMLSIQHFLCQPRRRPFREAVMARNMPESCKFPSLDSCQDRFLWTHKEVDLSCSAPSGWSYAPRRRCGDVSSGTWFRKPGSFFRVSKQGPCFTAMEENGGDKRLAELELACEAEGVAPPDPVQSGHCCLC